jgi:hypothetical protein
MNIIGLATILLIVCGALLSPVLLLWGGYCLTHRTRRVEGILILTFGALGIAPLLALCVLTNSPPHSPGLFRFQALLIFAGFFGLGAAVGKAFHLAGSWWKFNRRLVK